MSAFYFFTDADLLDIQTEEQSHGPTDDITIDTVVYNQYRTTSIHTASSDPSAYAICDGIVMVQENPDDLDLVNLILRPFSQPQFNIGFVKYFIYRGIKKNSLIDGDQIADAETNDLTQSIWDAQDAVNLSIELRTGINPEDIPNKNVIGVNYRHDGAGDNQLLNSALIDTMFYRDFSEFQFPFVNGGWKIGTFDSENFGLDIFIEKLGSNQTFINARKSQNVVQVEKLSATPTQAQQFEHKHKKEQILSYLDTCAFFGSFYGYELYFKTSIATDFLLASGNEVGNIILSSFYNKNILYLDIRNEINFSINYFENYGNEIKLSFEEAGSFAEFNYYNFGWPMLKILNSSFPDDNETEKNYLRLLLPLGDNLIPFCYIKNAIVGNSWPQVCENSDSFLRINYSPADDFVNTEVRFTVPNNNSIAGTNVISTYIRLLYCKRYYNNYHKKSDNTVIRRKSDYDVFQLNYMHIPWVEDSNKVQSFVFNEEYFVDSISELGQCFIVKLGIAKDLNGNYYFFMIPISWVVPNRDIGNVMEPSLNFNSKSLSHWELLLKSETDLMYSAFEIQNETEEIVFARVLQSLQVELSDDYSRFDPNDFIIESFNSTEYALLNELIDFHFLPEYPIMISYTKVIVGRDKIARTNYSKYSINLVGYYLEDDVINVKSVPTDITRYKLDLYNSLLHHPITNKLKIVNHA